MASSWNGLDPPRLQAQAGHDPDFLCRDRIADLSSEDQSGHQTCQERERGHEPRERPKRVGHQPDQGFPEDHARGLREDFRKEEDCQGEDGREVAHPFVAEHRRGR